jgi:hypothetical protein
VLAPVLFGERLTGDDLTARSLAMGLVALGVCVVLFWMASKRARTEMTPILVCTGVFSVVFYLAPTVVGGISAPRYGVPAALGVAFGIGVMIAQILRSDEERAPVRGARRRVLAGVGVVTLVCWVVALPAGRPPGPSWSASVLSERRVCAERAAESVVVPISPPGWLAQVPCTKIVALPDR